MKLTYLLAALLAGAMTAHAQDSPMPRTFDVASVKPNTSGDFRRAIGPGPGGRFQALNNTLRELVTYVYGVDMARAGLQIAGGPSWMDSDRFDIDAVAPGGAATPAEAREMVRALLAERFKLQARRETREVPTYDLVVDRRDGRLGSKLRASTIDCEARRAAARRGAPPPAPTGPPPNPETIRPVCGLRQTPVRFAGDAVSMTQLASALGQPSGRIVFDRTGLSGYFDVDLEWAQGQDDPSTPPIFTAVREQLGLRLEGSRAPVEMVVVISAERPSGN